jgi:hypothetical protein
MGAGDSGDRDRHQQDNPPPKAPPNCPRRVQVNLSEGPKANAAIMDTSPKYLKPDEQNILVKLTLSGPEKENTLQGSYRVHRHKQPVP